MYPAATCSSKFSLLESKDLKQGLSGLLKWGPHQESQLEELCLDHDTSWTLSNGYVSGRGNVDFAATPEGWNVFSLSTFRPAQHVAGLLRGAEHWDRGQWSREVESRLSHSFFWDLFPGAIVVAVHPGTGTVCFIRDALGFYPLYYARAEDGVKFSTSLAQLHKSVGDEQVDDRAISELLIFGHQLGCRTVWKSIDVATPGQAVVFQGDSRRSRYTFITPETVFDPELRSELSRRSVADLVTESRELTERSLARNTPDRPCVVQGGGGVDSSVLMALTAGRNKDIPVWSINHPDLQPCEEEWMKTLWRKYTVTSRFANVTRDNFLETLLQMLVNSCQPLIGPNFVGGAVMRQAAVRENSADLHFINGELCDTLFGGLSSFLQLSWPRRLSTSLRRLPRRLRHWVHRGVGSEREWFTNRTLAMPPDELAHVACGSLERSELIDEVMSLRLPGSGMRQVLADQLLWLDFRTVPRGLYAFYERDEWFGGHWVFPFADKELFRFAINLPYHLKYRGGHTKWLWRTMAAELIGKEAAFRPKYSFDAPIGTWLKSAVPLLHDGYVRDVFRVSRGDYLGQLAQRNGLLWPLVNMELWGRIHCRGESPDKLLERLNQANDA
jgi:asparagine synthase (glutamine-hydrolysing)